MKKFIAALAVSTALLVTPVAAQDNCGTTAQAEAIVAEFKEIPIISWITEKGEIIMVFANLDKGTSTVFATRPDADRVCIVSTGTNVIIGAPKKTQRVPGKDEL